MIIIQSRKNEIWPEQENWKKIVIGGEKRASEEILRNNRFALVICGIDGLSTGSFHLHIKYDFSNFIVLWMESRREEPTEKRQKMEDARKKGNGALSQATPDKSAFLRFSFLRLIERCFDNHLKTRAESNSLVLADRFLITLFVVEISDSTVDLKEETKKFGRRWAHKSHKKGSRFRWKYRKKVVHLTEAGAEDKQMVRLTRHKVTTQHGNWRKARLLMQNWFHFMALLLQIKMKRRAGKWYCERLWSEVKYYFVPWTFPRFTNLMTTSVV